MQCRIRAAPRQTRIEEVASRRLIEKFAADTRSHGSPAGVQTDRTATASSGSPGPAVDVESDREGVVLTVDGEPTRLSRDAATALREHLADALTRRREYLHTAGEHREDGSYVVARRSASSAGHRKVFADYEALVALYEELPEEFTAEDVGRSGLTGGRRHMLVRHFAEHPGFDCELVSQQPLTAAKVVETKPDMGALPAD